MNDLIFGKDKTERVVGLEVFDTDMVIYTEDQNGNISHEFRDHAYWSISTRPSALCARLDGDRAYKYMTMYTNYDSWLERKKDNFKRRDLFVHDPREAAMIFTGITMYKGMKIQDVSVLAFDIETTGLAHNDESKVLLISNTFRKNGKVIKKVFSYDDYESDKKFLEAWCSWVREVNPSIIHGHNIISYDLPYILFCAKRVGAILSLGRDYSEPVVDEFLSKKRKDGSQKYDYHNVRIFGREVIDTFFLAITYDIGRKYVSYGLKQIIKQEKLEKSDRQFYDAGKIKDNYGDPDEWAKIKAYAMDDADDALALYDLMAPSYFYFTQSIPKSFQQIVNTATGSQLNSFMLRAYLQDGKSVPKPSESNEFQGAISFGIPGIYKNAFKVDVASLYPSIMLTYDVYDKYKDPEGLMLKSLQHFTAERLRNKKLAKETGDPYYKSLEQSQKIAINSMYGFMGAPGLNFNSPSNAAFVTEKGREILNQAIVWASGKDTSYWIGQVNGS